MAKALEKADYEVFGNVKPIHSWHSNTMPLNSSALAEVKIKTNSSIRTTPVLDSAFLSKLYLAACRLVSPGYKLGLRHDAGMILLTYIFASSLRKDPLSSQKRMFSSDIEKGSGIRVFSHWSWYCSVVCLFGGLAMSPRWAFKGFIGIDEISNYPAR